MKDKTLESIVKCMAVYEINPDVQKIQTEHRMKLVKSWEIKKGDKILEIGCGQGDTTAVLAHYVGEEGYVHGIDIADPSYGSPITVGDSAEFLLKSELGSRISMEFNVDILRENIDFKENKYDVIVFSHSSWYFKSKDELFKVLKKVRKYGKRLCYAEYDTRIEKVEQYTHQLAVIIQAQIEAYKKDSSSNIRTLITPYDVIKLMDESGWSKEKCKSIYSEELQDGVWEIEYVLNEVLNDVENMTITEKMKELLKSQGGLLRYYRDLGYVKPLSSLVIIAN